MPSNMDSTLNKGGNAFLGKAADSLEEQENQPMRVVWLEKNGLMRDLWLPPIREGKYVFSGAEELVSIVAENHSWVAVAGQGVAFVTNYGKTKKAGLKDGLLVAAVMGERTFSLYAELDHGNSNAFLPYSFERITGISIGRARSCDMCCDNPFFSRTHAIFRWDGTQWTILDNGSKNGVYVNGKSTRLCKLKLGDVIYIVGLYIIVGHDFFAINNADDRMVITSSKVRLIPPEDYHLFSSRPVKEAITTSYFDRRPRKKYKLTAPAIEIDMPPTPMSSNKIPLALRMGNMAVMGGRAFFTGNYVSALTSLVFPALTQGYSEKDRKEYESKRVERYREYLRCKEAEIQSEIQYEEEFLNDIFPDLQQALTFTDKVQRLWERRRIDEDFLVARIGCGERAMVAEKRYSPRHFEMEPDHLLEEMYQIAERPTMLHDAPITVSLLEDWVLGIVGDHKKTLQLVRNLIAYLAVTHAYDELKIAVFASPKDIEQLQFVRYLRHFWSNDRSVRFLAGGKGDAQVIAKLLSDEFGGFEGKGTTEIKTELKNHPAYVVFVLDKDVFDQIELFKKILQNENYAGISIVTAFDNAPKECSKLIDFRLGNQLVDLIHPEVNDLTFHMDKIDDKELSKSMDRLAQIYLRMNEQSYALPPMVTFLEMYKVGRVEHLNPLARWSENNPVNSLAVPIGVGTDGSLFTLDLHEKRQGPHGLVAGMTGSGKSEFIITYILSMALNFSPEEVAFILIDYKGGGLADAFEDKSKGIHLPHLVGTITNLDGAAIQRSLMSINSELKRRQAVFKKAKSETNEGTMDIYDYQKLYRAGKVSEPMPHLFIISDEFAELKKQQPEFMDELISTARIGRSLGVHLILATQKPGGVVNDQIWSNTKFRVCLKVQDRGDSMEMLKRPEAAELKHTGRFYLQVGYNEYFALGQSAWCGAGYFPQDEVAKEEDNSVDFIDTVGQTVLSAKPKVVKKKADCKQIVAIVRYLSDLAVRERIRIRSMWMEPLPAKLEFSTLQEPETEYISAVLGTVDDPERQTQFPMEINLQSFHHMLLVGGSGSGKSFLLRTMLYSLVTRYSPEDVNCYIMDLSAGAMAAFGKAPHCGAYLTEENEADFDRLLRLVKELVAERKKLFAEAEVFSFDAYRKMAKLPLVLVVIDSWMNMTSFRKFQEINLGLPEYLRESANYGIRFILSVNHITEATAKIRQELDYRLILRPQDKFDYNDVLNVRGTMLPPQLPGRGMCVVEGRALEFHVAVPNCMEEDSVQNARLKESMEEISKRCNRTDMVKKLPVLEGVLEYESVCEGMETDRIPLGLSLETMQKVAMPLQQLYTAALYFGNPIGIRPVVTNLLTAFRREEADVIVMRRRAGTIFNKKAEEDFQSLFNGHFTILDCTVEGMVALDAKIIENISNTKVMHRNAYCEQNGIPASDRGRTRKAARYIRQHSKPLFVLFESLPDFIQLDMTREQLAEYTALFEQIMGYNVYFFGCFYPEDENLSSKPLFRSFMKEDFAMLFGGRYGSVWCTPLTNEYRRMEKVNPRYDRFIMKYHNECHRMIMPCGELITSTGDPDESEIV